MLKKRIQPIYYDEIKDYVKERVDVSKIKELSNEKGNNLLKFLQLIKEPPFAKEILEKLPIVEQMRQSISPFQDFGFVMPTVFETLEPFKIRDKSLKNSYRFGYFPINANCLFIENSEIIELLEKLTNKGVDGKPQRKIKTLDRLQFTGSKADIDKQITEITNGAITNETDYNGMIAVLKQLNASMICWVNSKFDIRVESENNVCNCLACRYNRFEFDKLFELLSKLELTNEEISNCDNLTYNLLLKGYIANKIGLYKIAFKSFIEASKLAKKYDKPVLLFISQHNLKYIGSFIFDDNNSEVIEKYSEGIDLQSVLNGLKVPIELRKELDKIKTEKYLREYTDIARKSRDKIIENHKLFENGGATTGNGEDNIHNLMINFVIIRQFYEKNCLIDTEYELFRKFIELCFESMIYNYTTSPVKGRSWSDSYTRLKSINPFFLQSVVLYASSDKLHEILLILGDKKLIIDDIEERKQFIDCVVNFFKSFYKSLSSNVNKDVLNSLDNSFIFNSKCKTFFSNFILLLGKIEFADAEFSATIQPLLHFLSVETYLHGQDIKYWQFYLETNIRRYKKERQKELFNIFLDKEQYRHQAGLIATMAYEVEQTRNVLFEEVSEIEKIYNNLGSSWKVMIFELYPISSPDVQKIITEKGIEILKSQFDSRDYYRAVKLKVLPSDSFLENAIQETTPYLKAEFDNLSNNFTLINFLYFIGSNCIDTSEDSFLPFINNNDYTRWLFRFNDFDYLDFRSEWFGYHPTSHFLHQMASNKDVKTRLKQHLKVNKNDDDFLYLSKIYFEYFV